MSKGLVLYFHRENDGAMFERIIIALKQRYQLVSLPVLEELMLNKGNLDRICHISFDDGDQSFYHIVFPVLKKHGVPVSLFLSPEILVSRGNYWFQEVNDYEEDLMRQIISTYYGLPVSRLEPFSIKDIIKQLPYSVISHLISTYRLEKKYEPKPPYNMSLAEVLEVENSGLVTIGAHSLHHPILQNEDDQNSLSEIRGSLHGLQQLLGHPVRYFAYPNGIPDIDFGEREINYLRDNGVTMAFSTELDHISPGVNMLSIPRMGFPRMGLSPSNPLIYFRLSLGKKWINIKTLGSTSEKRIREKLKLLFRKTLPKLY